MAFVRSRHLPAGGGGGMARSCLMSWTWPPLPLPPPMMLLLCKSKPRAAFLPRSPSMASVARNCKVHCKVLYNLMEFAME
jgi:hypothetical protein